MYHASFYNIHTVYSAGADEDSISLELCAFPMFLSVKAKRFFIDELSGSLPYMQKLRKMVVDRLDMLCFQPMHSRDCSQVWLYPSIHSVRVLFVEAFVMIT